MKALIVTNMYPTPDFPHIGTFVKEQVEALRRLGVEVELVAEGGRPGRGLSAFPKYFRLWRDVRRALRHSDPDVLHAHYLYPTGALVLLANRGRRSPVVVTAHGSDVAKLPSSGWLRRKLSRFAMLRADSLIAVSNALRDLVRREVSVESEAVRVVHMGVNVDRFRPGDRTAARAALGLPAEGVQAVLVAIQFEPKGGRVLLEALARVRTDLPAASLVHVVGVSPPAEIEAEMTRLDVSSLVRFHGPRSHEEMPTWLQACDLFLLPSFAEGLPISLLEAMASGMAVIATSVGGIPEIVRSGENGELVAPRQVDELAHALRTLFHDRETRDRMGRRARDTAEANSVESSARSVMAIYERLVG